LSKTDYCVDPANINIGDGEQEPGTGEAEIPVIGASRCKRDGTPFLPDYGEDSAPRLLLREGVIDEIPTDICDMQRNMTMKNVILVVGDGMGWEMVSFVVHLTDLAACIECTRAFV
jgi:hypothetical protein